jgi:hypothetical protein
MDFDHKVVAMRTLAITRITIKVVGSGKFYFNA